VRGWNVCDDTILNEADTCVNCAAEEPTDSTLYKALHCLVDFDEANYDSFKSQWQSCQKWRGDYLAKESQCDQLQTNLENQKCHEQETIHEVCDIFDTCWSTTNTAYDTTKSTVQSLENTFQKQYDALQCLKCYGEQILNTTTDLSRCENQPVTNFQCPAEQSSRVVSDAKVEMAICYPPLPAPADCESQKDFNVPGTTGYEATYYGVADNTCAAVDHCFHTCDDKYAS